MRTEKLDPVMKSFLFLFVFLFWNGCLFAQEIQRDSIKVDSNESRMPLQTTELDSIDIPHFSIQFQKIIHI